MTSPTKPRSPIPEDLLVVVHPARDVAQETLLEHQPEVVQIIRSRLCPEVWVGDHVGLELLQQEPVRLPEIQPEPVIDDRDDLRERCLVRVVLLAAPVEDRRQLARA